VVSAVGATTSVAGFVASASGCTAAGTSTGSSAPFAGDCIMTNVINGKSIMQVRFMVSPQYICLLFTFP
jgi:hypothetical protein